MIESILSIAKIFFEKAGIPIKTMEGIVEDAQKHIYQIKLVSDDSKLIIGVHGANLDAINHIISRIIEHELKIHVILHIEINDYLAQKDERLFRYIDGKIASISQNGGELTFPQLTPYERRKVHNYIAEKNIPGLSTHSVGEGNQRIMHLTYERITTQQTPEIGLNEEGVGI